MATPTLLIQKSDFDGFVEFPNNLSPAKLATAIQQAQQFDLSGLMGFDFYSDFIFDNSSPQYQSLLNGGTYNTKYNSSGLKVVLIFFAAARLIRCLDLHITPHGMMQKRNEWSDHADAKAIGMKATEYENTARAYWQESVNFIQYSGKTLFPLWGGFGCNPEPTTGRQRIIGVSGKSIHSYGRSR